MLRTPIASVPSVWVNPEGSMQSKVFRAAAAFALLLISLACHATPNLYRITDLGDLPGGVDFSEAHSINNAGEIVGESAVDTGVRAYRWTAHAGMRALPIGADGIESEAFGINANGFVAGRITTAAGSAAVRWGPGGMVRPLASLGEGLFDVGYAVNRLGNVAGYSVGLLGLRAFVWTIRTGTVDLGDLPGGDGRSLAFGINDQGMVVGSSDVQSPRRSTNHAFIWTPDQGLQDIGTLRGPSADFFSEARAVNNAGQVVGISDAPTGQRAFLWQADRGMMDLGELPQGNGYSSAWGVNERGHAVGVSDSARGFVAFVWSPETGMRDLNDLIDPTDPLKPQMSFSAAYDINDRGQIVGSAFINGVTRAYLLTPVTTASAR
jgi:probable HAF family extracellular repeat protein